MKRKRFDGHRASAEPAIEDIRHEREVPHWRSLTRVAFRFCVVYLGLFSLATQISGSLFLVPNASFRGLGPLWPMREITIWVGTHVFGVAATLDSSRNSGETVFFWVQTFWLLAVAVLVTGVWSALDRRRRDYARVHKWFRLFVRFALASQMFEYGMTKVIPTQFPPPSLNILVTPVGDLSLETLLWTSIGASPAFEMFMGCAELLGGILLLVPRTTMVGALICLADLTLVFAFNMAYDIGLKLISFHLILMALFLLAPDFPRLAKFFFLNRVTPASLRPQLFRTRRANQIGLAAQILCGVYLLGTLTYINASYWFAAGGGAPKSPLHGIWNVEQLAIDGQVRPPVLNDYDRQWRRVIFDSPDSMVFQRTNDSLARYSVAIDLGSNTLALTKGNSRNWKSSFTFQRPAVGQLTLNGEMDGYRIYMQLELVEFDTLRLLNSTFRWVRPVDP